MRHVCIGVHVHEQPERLHATLAHLRANTPGEVDLVLLPDGPDASTSAALAALDALPQLGTTEPLGSAACFNRLVRSSAAPTLVFLESGSLVGPGWLEHLLAALAADPRNGLAGPSTNISWNEQCIFGRGEHGRFAYPRNDSFAEIARAALELDQYFGAACRTLEPLHSLADFCYVVRREVVEAIGAADEGYGLGPCWEMDYNIRAARAGFRGVWACSAYVHRAPFTARRAAQETLRFEASKHRYQDKFCALRLRRESVGYEPHCRGEECEHFAPVALMQVSLPLPGPLPLPAPQPTRRSSLPLVSCIMPTQDRGEFALQSVRYFLQQDYPERELIILDDGAEDLSARLPGDSRIRYLHLPRRMSIGAKRNRGCELATGSIIAHWDDDDWYASNRLSAQIAPLLAGEAQITALRTGVFFDLSPWKFWRCAPEVHRRMFVEDVHGGTLVYFRRIWEQSARYPDASLAEDACFLREVLRHGARLQQIPGDGLFAYLRHGQNSWSFTCGQFIDPRGWQLVEEPPLPPADRAFYLARSPVGQSISSSSPQKFPASQPLVSCIMPTADRRWFVPQAIRYFQRQDYSPRELIIVDDGVDPVADLIPPDPRICYVRLEARKSLGAKRNMACELARGDWIVHWDDDDWMSDQRLSLQIGALSLRAGTNLCGLSRLYFYDPQNRRAWIYENPPGQRAWVAGGTFCYQREFWRQHSFQDTNEGEDTRFVWANRHANILELPDPNFYVAIIHARNTCPKHTRDVSWHPCPSEQIRELMRGDWPFYDARSVG